MLLTSQNHSTDWIYHFHGPKKRAPPELGQKSRITKICVGVCQKFFPPTFLDVFLDVESDKKNRLKFWPSGAEKSPFFWFWPHTGQFYLVIFSKNEKIFQKSMFYGLFCSKFCTDHFSAVHFGLSGPTYAKNSKNTNIFEPPLTISVFGPSILSLPNYSLSFPLFVPSILTFSLLFLSFPLFGPSILSTKTVQ